MTSTSRSPSSRVGSAAGEQGVSSSMASVKGWSGLDLLAATGWWITATVAVSVGFVVTLALVSFVSLRSSR